MLDLESSAVVGNIYRLKLALNGGADPRQSSVLFGTVLHAAAVTGHLEIVGLLIEQEADFQRVGGAGQTAAKVPTANCRKAVAEFPQMLP